jgi:hypothetical protein
MSRDEAVLYALVQLDIAKRDYEECIHVTRAIHLLEDAWPLWKKGQGA